MTDNEKELMKIISENDHPEDAIMTAAVIILSFLKRNGSFSKQALVGLREQV